MTVAGLAWAALHILKRDVEDADSTDSEPVKKEIFASWSLFILITLLIAALFTSYVLQSKKIQAVHETVISIFAGMFVGLVLRLTAVESVLGLVRFDYQFFFNLLLPPIILASGYELHQANFFRHIGTILTFAFAGTFISAVVLGVILWIWSKNPFEVVNLSFVDAISVGATLSATDPITILAIFNTYKVDPKLYTIIFGESILNDAVAIVLFETAQRYKPAPLTEEARAEGGSAAGSFTTLKLFEGVGLFFVVFFGSLIIGLVVGICTSLLLKFTMVRRFPKLESCIVLLIAYASYFFANAIHMSGIVSLLFCGICLKHYAYHNMSRRTQLTTKFIFQILSQLSENFIFIYLGLSLFTEQSLDFRPLFILVTVVGICIARGLAVFPLSKAVNFVIRYRARKQGREVVADELSFAYQAMLFWAGLRGAVGVALAAGLTGTYQYSLRATILVVVVLTVIIFGGTTARMLEILGIRTGVVDDADSDDEFDIEVVGNGVSYGRKHSAAHDYPAKYGQNGIPLAAQFSDDRGGKGLYSSGNARTSPPNRANSGLVSPRKSSIPRQPVPDASSINLLSPADSPEYEGADLDLPPSARRSTLNGGASTARGQSSRVSPAPAAGTQAAGTHPAGGVSTAAGLRQFLAGSAEDPAQWFRNLDEEFIKPHLLLDSGDGHHGGV